MVISSLELTNFRNFPSLETISFDEGLNVLIAPNGFGKSNVLEAIYVLSRGSSPRSSRSSDMIQWDENIATIEGDVDDRTLRVALQRSGKTFLIDGQTSDLKSFVQRFTAIYFHPPDLNLLSGSPQNRRTYLNQLIGSLDFRYLHALTEYRKLLQRRNALLKESSFDEQVMTIIEEQLSEYATEIIITRTEKLQELSTILSKHGMRIEYLVSPRGVRELMPENAENMQELREDFAGNMQEIIREKLEKLRRKEKDIGFTLIGPQRDDFVVYVEDQYAPNQEKDVGRFGSRGQQRLAIIRLKLGACDILEQNFDARPILLLDDVFSELDEKNRGVLAEAVSMQQTFITAAHPEDVAFLEIPHNSLNNLRELIEKNAGKEIQ